LRFVDVQKLRQPRTEWNRLNQVRQFVIRLVLVMQQPVIEIARNQTNQAQSVEHLSARNLGR
jgi:hypothetical protein